MDRITSHALATAAVLIALGGMSAPAAAERPFAAEPSTAPLRGSTLRGSGEWQRGERGAQRWDIEVTYRDETTIEGRVTLAGSPLLRTGVLRGTLDGRRVSGSVSDQHGNQVATFTGAVLPSGLWRGSYQDRTGEVGQWRWNDAPPPRTR